MKRRDFLRVGSLATAGVLLSNRKISAEPIPYQFPLKLHGAPDKAFYNDATEFPTDSFQHHWSAVGATGFGSLIDTLGFNPKGTILMPAHIHLDLNYPRYAEITGPFTVYFTIKAFHFAGSLAGPWASNFKPSTSNDNAYDWFFDDTQSPIPPKMVGDPTGLLQWTGRFSINPRLNFHGWDAINLAVIAYFDNKDLVICETAAPYFNNVNPNAPITIGSQGPANKPNMGTLTSPFVFNSTDAFGTNEMELENYLPVAPLTSSWMLPPMSDESITIDPKTIVNGHGIPFKNGPVAFTNSYGGSSLLNTIGSYQTRQDLNFHAGIPGITLVEYDYAGIIPAPMGIDNTGLLPGAHQYGFIRFQPENSIPTNGVATLLVIQVPVLGSTPPPMPTWQTLGTVNGQDVQQLLPSNTNQFRMCKTNTNQCTSVLTEQ